MITHSKYIEYLISTPINYTCTNLSEHLSDVSHDSISNFLKNSKNDSVKVWENVKYLLLDSVESCLIIDDSVQNKEYSKSIEIVKKQYSGATGGLVRGIGIVNLVHTDGKEHYPIDYRIYSPEFDFKTKNDHFIDMLNDAINTKELKSKTILFDSWYASWVNLKLVNSLNLNFYTTLKNNRLVSVDKSEGYIHLDDVKWDDNDLNNGIMIKLKKIPFKVRLFKIVSPNGDIDWLITNNVDNALNQKIVIETNSLRWKIEQFHRELKQLTGIEKCQCRKAQSQRNHIKFCYQAWISLKVYAKKMGETLYHSRKRLFSKYLNLELKNPRIKSILVT